MAQIPQYFAPEANFPQGREPAPADTSAMDHLSANAMSFADEQAKQAAAEQGAQDQAKAGTDAPVKNEGLFGFIPTTYSETYNKAANIAYVESKKAQLESGTQALQQKYGNDLDQFQTELTKFRTTFMANVPLKSQPQFDLLWQDHTGKATQAVTAIKLQNDFKTSQGTIINSVDDLTNKLTNSIANDPFALSDETHNAASSLSHLIDASTKPFTDPKTGQTYPAPIDPVTAAKMHQTLFENVARASAKSTYESLPSIGARKNFLDNLEKGGYKLPVLPGLNDSGNAQIPATMAQTLATELRPKFQQDQAFADADYFLKGGKSAPQAPAAGFQPASYAPPATGGSATTPAPSTAAPAPSPDDTFAKNTPFVNKDAGSSFQTTLAPDDETKFQQWVKDNKVPFSDGPKSDYDMRGYYKALMAGDTEHTQTGVNANDGKMHFTDYFKTPYHKSFSAESKFADPTTAPKWNEKDQLVTPDGNVVFDEKAQNAAPAAPPQPSSVIIPPSSRIAYVHNNPGNLKFAGQEGATRGEPASDGGYYAKFVTPEDGANALVRQVGLDASRGLTLAQFVTKYAPPSSNDTAHYILATASLLNTNPNMPISALPVDGLVSTVARLESNSVVGQAAQTRNAIKMDHATTVAELDNSLGGDPARASRARSIINERYQTVALAAQADYAEKQRQAADDAKQKLAASDAAESAVLQKIFPQPDPNAPPGKAGPQITPADVIDPNGAYKDLTNAKKIQMVELIKSNARGEPMAAESHANVVDLIKRIRLPDTDPTKIKDTGALYEAYNAGKLTNNDFLFAQKQFNDMTTPDGEQLSKRKAQFIKGVTPLIDHSNPLLGSLDPSGPTKLYEYEYFIDKKIEEFRAAGKDPHILFNPGTPQNPNKEYLGQYVGMFQKTIQESSADVATSMSRTSSAPAPAKAATAPPAQTTAVPRRAPDGKMYLPVDPTKPFNAATNPYREVK